MAYGIEIKNGSGVTILDGNSPVFTEVASGTLSVNVDAGPCYKGVISIPSQYTNPIVAYQLPVGKWLSLWRSEVYANKETGTAAVPYKIFAPVNQLSPSGDTYGLRIYDAAGNLIFDSGRLVFNVLSNHLFTVNASLSTAFTNTGHQWVLPSTAGVRGLRQVSSNTGMFLGAFIRQNSSGSVSALIKDLANGPFPSGGDILTPATCNAVRIAIT